MYYHTDSHWLSLHCFGITKTMVSVRCVQQFDAKLNFWIMQGGIRKGCDNKDQEQHGEDAEGIASVEQENEKAHRQF